MIKTIDHSTFIEWQEKYLKKSSYIEDVLHRNKRNSLTMEEAQHPDYLGCTQEMTSLVEQYDRINNPPDRLIAYVGKDDQGRPTATTWMGDPLSVYGRETSKWRTPRSFVSKHMRSYEFHIGGRVYHGRCGGEGLSIRLKARKA